jgi:outer membrane protein OmpA-like peptidoglycan-associated protein
MAAGAACFGSSSLQAATPLPAGWYIQGGAGVNWPRDVDNNVGGIERETTHDLGWLGVGSVGYGWQNGLRLELEGSYRSNSIDEIAGAGGQGDVNNTAIMTNLIYQYQTTGWVIPYVGLGVGAGHVSYDNVRPLGGPPTTTVDDSDWSPAFQAMVGVEFPITQNLGLNVGYRFLYEPGIEMTAANGAGVDTTYQSHAVLVGLRWSFGAPEPMMAAAEPPRPAPAPTPAPPPAPAMQQAPSQYLVFFDWDSAVLTAEAQRIIRTASDAAKQGRVARIEVTGHADRSGPDAYNVRLSQRRADAVKAELVKNGVATSDIATFAKGETDPLVPTADGVREPQNRRVQIVFPQARPGS